ncbi:heparan-alpha-glucosaminide N-acetyltransferase domain-containing protein [Piscinibacter sakaiensis]|uniref:heparan-alpha-glucosaminide N-acetyltransferase domain-containing protein n=1 Tax=Piscinibacter sakaiensis TaxID=1547922 RepID=UPI003AAD7891
MALFHFGFDLDYFGLIDEDFYRDPFWTRQRAVIVSLFLAVPGWAWLSPPRKSSRGGVSGGAGGRSAGGALLVSIGSYLVFPRSFMLFRRAARHRTDVDHQPARRSKPASCTVVGDRCAPY